MTASRATQHSTLGGSSETELNALAVMPWIWAPPVDSTVTPVAKRDMAVRSELPPT